MGRPFVETSVAHKSAMSTAADACFKPDSTRDRRLTPWELANARALHTVALQMARHWSMSPSEVLGSRVDAFIAKKIVTKEGGHPIERAVRAMLQKCSDREWSPSRQIESYVGRKRVYSELVRSEVARVAMDMEMPEGDTEVCAGSFAEFDPQPGPRERNGRGHYSPDLHHAALRQEQGRPLRLLKMRVYG